MTTKVHGKVEQGVWFTSSDVRFLNVQATGATWLTDLTVAGQPHDVNTGLEATLESVGTRATIIGLNVISETELEVIVDHAQAYDGTDIDVVTEVEALIDAISGYSAAAIVVNQAWTGDLAFGTAL